MLIAEALTRGARHHPARDCVVSESATTSFAGHLDRADRLAAGLRALGCEGGDRIAIIAENTPECVEAFSACERSGLIAVPCNYRLLPQDLAGILEDCQPRVVIFQRSFADAAQELRARVGSVSEWVVFGGSSGGAIDYEELVARDPAQGSDEVSSAGDVAYLIYTSGTTGLPKGVKLSHRAVYAMARTIALEGGIESTDRFLLVMPLYHIGGKSVQLAHLLRGGSVCVVPRFSAGGVLEAIERHGATTLLAAPTMIRALVEHPDFAPSRLTSLRKVFYAAAPIQEDLLRQAITALGPIFTQFYGSTEGGAVSTVLPDWQHETALEGDDPARLRSAGRACIDCDVAVIDADGRPRGSGEVGQVITRTAGMMTGYWNNDTATNRALRDGWLHTGDLGYLDDEGFLYLVDRMKDVIVTGGENVYSGEVERVLETHESVAECAVIGVPDAYWGESVLAVVVTAGKGASADELIAYCGERLAGYKKPKRVDFVDSLPKLPSGKVKKVALREQYWGPRERRIN